MRKAAIAVAMLVCAAQVGAQEVPRDTTGVHEVRAGDTLWDLARRYLQDPFRWPEIHRLNADRVPNPHRIFPTELLRIPRAVRAQPAAGGGFILVRTPEPERTVFFGGVSEVTRPQSLIRPVEVEEIPTVLPGDFFRAGMLLPEAEVRPLGVLVELVGPTVVPLEIPAQIALYDRVFMTVGQVGAVAVGNELHLMRAGRRVRPHGRLFEPTGIARVLAVDGRVATLEVQQLYSTVRVGDLAMAMPRFEVPAGVLPEPAVGLEGRIITFVDPHPLQSTQEVAFIDLGRASGVTEGDEFEVVLPRSAARWGVRPEIPVGRLQVVRTGERSSAVRVTALEHPALAPGLLVRRVSRMP